MFTSSTRDIPDARGVPRHVAIIMDGNGRWAKQRMLPRVAGHRRGVEAVRAIILACIERDIEFLTLFAFSSENWRRPARRSLDPDGPVPARAGAGSGEAPRERHPLQGGRRHVGVRLGESASSIAAGEAQTAAQHAPHADGRGELRRPLGHRAGGAPIFRGSSEMRCATAAALRRRRSSRYLAMAYAPEPDLFIRTGGEQRISNFLLWQLAYTELYFTDMLWPDFDADRAQCRDRVVSAARAPLRPNERAGAGGAGA